MCTHFYSSYLVAAVSSIVSTTSTAAIATATSITINSTTVAETTSMAGIIIISNFHWLVEQDVFPFLLTTFN